MINHVQNKQIAFNGYHGSTIQDGIIHSSLVHYTMMFRDLPILDFVQNYARKNFPEGTRIVDFACSQGQEAHTLAMLLSDVNKDKKYKITGYDIDPVVIAHAKKRLFVIENNGSEAIAFLPRTERTSTGF